MTAINFNSRCKNFVELSNFHPCMLEVNGVWVKTTVEHEYQARKFEIAFQDKQYAEYIRRLPTAKEAKSAGSKAGWVNYMKKFGPPAERKLPKSKLEKIFKLNLERWIAHSVATMKTLLEQKFDSEHNPELRRLLTSTSSCSLHEFGRGKGFWLKTGQDMLGKLLMSIRDSK